MMPIREVTFIASTLALLLIVLLVVISQKSMIKRLFQQDVFWDVSTEFRNLQEIHGKFTLRRKGDFFDKWAEDLSARARSSGFVGAVGQGLWDILTVGGAARKRARANELQAAAYLAQSMENVGLRASENLRGCIASTALRIDHGFKLLKASQKITEPLLKQKETRASPVLVRKVSALETRSHNLSMKHSQFIEIATAAGAGTATAVGLWGAVQVAGYASTHTAMAGLYGAAASNAGWAWFGGGSLATGGGGMALGHIILPGVGVAVGWTVLVTRLHQAANQMELQIRELEEWNSSNMPALASFIAVEGNYRRGSEDFRLALEGLHLEIDIANKKLRRFGVLSDWRRQQRVRKGKEYYTKSEISIVDRVASAVDDFLDRLPASQLQ